MLDTKVGNPRKAIRPTLRRLASRMMRGDGDVVRGGKNKLQSANANVTPAAILAEQHRKMAEPGYHRHNGSRWLAPRLPAFPNA
jgi:hypothetical protein